MTLHVVLGDGYMPTKELSAHLEDMKAKDLADDAPFWFLLQCKAEPTDTDRALVKWLVDNDIWFDAIGDKDSADKIYADAQTVHKATRLAPKIVSLMKVAKEGNEENEPEEAHLLALYFSDEDDAEEDRWLNDVIAAVADAGFQVFAFNDGMTPIEPGDIEGEEEAEGEPAQPNWVGLTREQLEAMDLDELKQVALDKGITVAPRSRKPTYIDAILGEDDEAPEVEIETPPPPPSVMNNVTPINTTSPIGTTSGSTMSNTLHISGVEVSGPAMIIVISNGLVTSRVITAEQAKELLSF